MDKHIAGLLDVWRHGDPKKQVPIFRKGDIHVRPIAWFGIKGQPNEANAQRVVATWNACDGVSTDRLHPGAVTVLLKAAEAVNAYRRHTMTCMVCQHQGLVFCTEARRIESEAWSQYEDALALFQGAEITAVDKAPTVVNPSE